MTESSKKTEETELEVLRDFVAKANRLASQSPSSEVALWISGWAAGTMLRFNIPGDVWAPGSDKPAIPAVVRT